MVLRGRYRKFVVFWQKLTWFVGHYIFQTVYSCDVRYNHSQIRKCKSRNVLFVMNHDSQIDHWKIFLPLDYESYRSLVPMRFLASTSFRHFSLRVLYGVLINPFIYFPNGVVRLVSRKNDKGLTMQEKLEDFVEVLRDGDVGIMYPEGHTRRSDEPAIRTFRPGVAYVHEVTNVPIVPVAIKMGSRKAYNLFRREYKVAFGSPTNIPKDLRGDYESGAEWVRKQVISLYESLE